MMEQTPLLVSINIILFLILYTYVKPAYISGYLTKDRRKKHCSWYICFAYFLFGEKTGLDIKDILRRYKKEIMYLQWKIYTIGLVLIYVQIISFLDFIFGEWPYSCFSEQLGY